MKCPKCNGKGKFIGYYVNDNPVECECVICNGTGEVQMTNEEWLHTLNTEEMVDYLYSVHKGGASVERQSWIEKHKERIKMQIRG